MACFDFSSAVDLSRSWTRHELTHYNVTISSLPPADFFLAPDPSLDHIDPAILDPPPDRNSRALSNPDTSIFLSSLDLAIRPTEDCFVVNFAAETLKLLGFQEGRAILTLHPLFRLTVFGESRAVVRLDVCLLHPPQTFALLVVINDEILTRNVDAEPHVVAAAIAAFQSNNRKRIDLRLDPLDTMTIPCIKMTGTRPTFYLVPVTETLSEAVIRGQHPATRTRVLRCPTAATHTKDPNAGMEDIEYRKLALKRFLVFKALARSHWERILEGVGEV